MSDDLLNDGDILLSPPGIDIGGNYNRSVAHLAKIWEDGAVGLLDDRGYRHGPFKPGHVEGRLEDGALLNAGEASRELKSHFMSIDQEANSDE